MVTIYERKVFGILRLLLGWIFLWSFLDKTFGLGFSTARENSWLRGSSPTAGFLEHGTSGSFEGVFQSMTGLPVIDWLYMAGMLLIGLSLITSIGIKVASYAGALMMTLLFFASMPPENNPFISDHIVYLVILLALKEFDYTWLSFAKWWQGTELVKRNPWMK